MYLPNTPPFLGSLTIYFFWHLHYWHRVGTIEHRIVSMCMSFIFLLSFCGSLRWTGFEILSFSRFGFTCVYFQRYLNFVPRCGDGVSLNLSCFWNFLYFYFYFFFNRDICKLVVESSDFSDFFSSFFRSIVTLRSDVDDFMFFVSFLRTNKIQRWIIYDIMV